MHAARASCEPAHSPSGYYAVGFATLGPVLWWRRLKASVERPVDRVAPQELREHRGLCDVVDRDLFDVGAALIRGTERARPVRPNPLIATRIGMTAVSLQIEESSTRLAEESPLPNLLPSVSLPIASAENYGTGVSSEQA